MCDESGHNTLGILNGLETQGFFMKMSRSRNRLTLKVNTQMLAVAQIKLDGVNVLSTAPGVE